MRAPITVVVTTYFPDGPVGESRFKSAKATLESWDRHLNYDGPLQCIIVNSTGPIPDKRQTLLIKKLHGSYAFLHHQGGVGGSLNLGFKWAREHDAPLVFYAADDWALDADFDLSPWADLLIAQPRAGMVRLGPPHPDLTGRVQMTPQGWVLLLERHHYAFGHRPALYHQRMIDAYGWFDEGSNAWECERLYNEHFCGTHVDFRDIPNGPEIVYALPYPWRHVGETEVGDLEPVR